MGLGVVAQSPPPSVSVGRWLSERPTVVVRAARSADGGCPMPWPAMTIGL
jgi:hypothetical protein